MQTTLKTLRLSQHGLPPLLLMSEYEADFRKEICAYLVWPEETGNHEPASLLVKVSMPYSRGMTSPDLAQVVETMREAALAGAIHHASKFCAGLDHPVDRVVEEQLDPSTLRAWRSLGLYKGLQAKIFDEQTAIFVTAGLDRPYDFAVS